MFYNPTGQRGALFYISINGAQQWMINNVFFVFFLPQHKEQITFEHQSPILP